MEKTQRSWTLGELSEILGGSLHGPPDRRVVRPMPAGTADREGITFAESSEYLAKIVAAEIGVVLVPRGSPEYDFPTIQVDRPRASFGRILALCYRPLPIDPGIHPTAVVSQEAIISATAQIGAYAVIERGVSIGEFSRIYPFAYIGEDCEIGAKVTIYPHAVLYQNVKVGDRSIVHGGAIIGADGFGFAWDGKDRNLRIKIPQVGSVEIGSDVEIGALSAIDRATAGSTVVSDGTKIDNLVQIAHNCRIGSHTVIAGQTAVGGSSRIGNRNDIGGQVAINDHVTITDDVILGGRTGVTNDIQEAGVYWGLPAKPILTAKRIIALMAKLPQLHKTIKDLERRLEELEQAKQ